MIKNIDQRELAEAIGVSQPTVSNWIQQTKYPRIKKNSTTCRLLQCTEIKNY